jgi:hypothetical protein
LAERTRRRSADFMASVANVRDVAPDMTFLEAVRLVEREWPRISADKAKRGADAAEHSRRLADWNMAVPPGTRVGLRRALGEAESVVTRTRSRAWALDDGTPVVFVEGKPGGYALTHLRPIPAEGGAHAE